MPQVSFALILSKNLALKNLQAQPVEAVIDITGAFTDPTTLERLREAVNTSFTDRRAGLNAFIERADKAVGLAPGRPAKEQLVEKFNVEMARRTKEFETALQTRMSKWIEDQKAQAREESEATTNFLVKCSWSVWKIGSSVVGAITGGVTAVPTGGTALALAAKAVFDTCKEAYGLINDLREHFQSEATLYDAIGQSRKEIRAAKGRPAESVVTRLETQLKAYSARISGIEKTARELSAKLDAMLVQAEKGGGQLEEDCARSIDALIQEITGINEGVNKARTFQKSSLDALLNAKRNAVKDPRSFLGFLSWFDPKYEIGSTLFEMASAEDASGILQGLMDLLVKYKTS